MIKMLYETGLDELYGNLKEVQQEKIHEILGYLNSKREDEQFTRNNQK